MSTPVVLLREASSPGREKCNKNDLLPRMSCVDLRESQLFTQKVDEQV